MSTVPRKTERVTQPRRRATGTLRENAKKGAGGACFAAEEHKSRRPVERAAFSLVDNRTRPAHDEAEELDGRRGGRLGAVDGAFGRQLRHRRPATPQASDEPPSQAEAGFSHVRTPAGLSSVPQPAGEDRGSVV